jgi:C4-dicarboxylate-specific signal transduction histidine kinase
VIPGRRRVALTTRLPHVLVVDDEPSILMVAGAVLADGPWRVSQAATYAAARAVLDAEVVDVLVTDKNLPDGNGLELLAVLKAADPQSEGIVITGYPSLDTALQALGRDAFDYLVKPLRDVHDLRRRVVQAVAKREIALQNRALLAELTRTNHALREALDETRRLRDDLVQSEKLAALGTLAAGVAHEVASPLFGILGLAEAIADETDVGVAHAHAKEIVGYCGAIRGILGDLARHARDAQHDPVEDLALATIAEEATRLVTRLHPAVTFSVTGDGHARARAGELRQVLVNLLRNGADAATPAHPTGGARVDVRIDTADGGTVVRVADNGPGVPQGVRRRVFDPFFTTKPPGAGTGLGLHVVWQITGRLGGKVALADAPDPALGGACFEVLLPAAPGGR